MADPGGIAGPPTGGEGGEGDVERAVAIEMTADTTEYNSAMETVIASTKLLGEAYLALEKAAIKAIKIVSGGAIAMGVAIQGFGAAAIATAASFEDSFARVGKTLQTTAQSGSSEFWKEFTRVGEQVRTISTEIPIAVSELAHLADVAGQLGVSSENVGLYVDVAAKLGAATSLGSTEAVAGLSRMINVTQMAEESITNLASSLAYLGNNTAASEAEMLEFGERVAGTASQLGYTADQILGVGSAVAATGTNAALGAVAFNEVILRMSTAAEKGGTDLAQFSNIAGVATDEFKRMVDEDPSEAFKALVEGLGKQGDNVGESLERLKLNASGSTQTFLNLAGASETLADSLNKSKRAFDEGTAISELAEIRFDTLKQKLVILKQTIAEIVRTFGMPFLGLLKNLVEAVTNMIKPFVAVARAIAPVVASLGALLGAVLSVGGGLGMFVASIAAVVIPLGALYRLVKMIRDGMVKLYSVVKASGVWAAMDVAVSAISAKYATLGKILSKVFISLKTFMIMNFSNGGIKQLADDLILLGKAKFALASYRIKKLGDAVKTYLVQNDIFPRAIDWLSKLSTSIKTYFVTNDIIPRAIGFLGKLSGAVKTYLADNQIFTTAMASIKKLAQTIKVKLGDNQLLSHITGVFEKMKKAIIGGWAVMLPKLTPWLGMLSEKMELVKKSVKAMYASLIAGGGGGFKAFLAYVLASTEGLRALAAETMGRIIPAFGKFGESIKRIASGIKLVGMNIASHLMKALRGLKLSDTIAFMSALAVSLSDLAKAKLVNIGPAFKALGTNIKAVAGLVGSLFVSAIKSAGSQLASFFKSMDLAGKFKTGWAAMTTSIRRSTAAMVSSVKTGFATMGAGMIRLIKTIAREPFHDLAAGLGVISRSMMRLASRIFPAVTAQALATTMAFGTLAAVVGGVVLLVIQGIDAFKRWQEANISFADQVDQLAVSLGVAYEGVKAYLHEAENAAETDMQLQSANQVLIDSLRELHDVAARSVVQKIGIDLVEGGANPDEVEEKLTKILELAGHDIRFGLDLSNLTPLEIVESQMRRINDELAIFVNNAEAGRDAWGEFIGHRGLSAENKAIVGADLGVATRMAEGGDVAGALATMLRQDVAARQGVEEGTIDTEVLEQLRDEIERSAFQANMVEERGFLERNILNRGVFGGHNAARGPMGILQRGLESGRGETEEWEPVVEVIEDMGIAIEDLTDLDISQVLELLDRLEEVSRRNARSSTTGMWFDENSFKNIDKILDRSLGKFSEASLQARDFHSELERLAEPGVGAIKQIRDELFDLQRRMIMAGDIGTEQFQHITQELQAFNETLAQTRAQIVQLMSTDWRTGELLDVDKLFPAIDRLNTQVDEIDFDTDSLEGQAQAIGEAQQAYDGLLSMRQAAVGELRALVEAEIDLNKAIEDSYEDLAKNIGRAGEDYAESLADLEEDRLDALEDAAEDYQDALEDIYEDHEEVLEDLAESVAKWLGAYERAWSQYAPSSDAMVRNLEHQNERLEEWIEGLQKLRESGLSEEAIKFLDLESSPDSLEAIKRLLDGDPSNIEEINALVKSRNETALENVDQFDTEASEALQDQLDDTREAYDDQLKDIAESFDDRLEDMAKSYDRRIRDMRRSTEDHVKDIQEQISELGEAVKTEEEIFALASESANDRIRKAGDTTQDVLEQTTGALTKLWFILIGDENALLPSMAHAMEEVANQALNLFDNIDMDVIQALADSNFQTGDPTLNDLVGTTGTATVPLGGPVNPPVIPEASDPTGSGVLDALYGEEPPGGVDPWTNAPAPIVAPPPLQEQQNNLSPDVIAALSSSNRAYQSPIVGGRQDGVGVSQTSVTNYNVDTVIANDSRDLARDLRERERVRNLVGSGLI